MNNNHHKSTREYPYLNQLKKYISKFHDEVLQDMKKKPNFRDMKAIGWMTNLSSDVLIKDSTRTQKLDYMSSLTKFQQYISEEKANLVKKNKLSLELRTKSISRDSQLFEIEKKRKQILKEDILDLQLTRGQSLQDLNNINEYIEGSSLSNITEQDSNLIISSDSA